MWFAALDLRTSKPWFDNLQFRLLQGSPPVLALFRRDLFHDLPPRFIRLTIYRYRFAYLRVRRNGGRWWERELIGRLQSMMLQEGED
jgi:hypothetical protein